MSFSIRLPALDFLQELFDNRFHKDKFSHLNNFNLGFTHFIALTYTPDKDVLLGIYERRAAIICQRNQCGVDLIIPLKSNNGNIGAILIQV